MNRSILLVSLAAVVLVPPSRAANLADFADYSLRSPAGQIVLPGRLFTPPEAAGPVPRPFIVFLHGGGASGTNNNTPVEHTPDYLLDEARRRGAFLYVPQTPTNWSPSSIIDSVATMIDRVVDEHNADPRRLYATGYSNGGGGAWNLLSRHPGRFAAAVAIAGVAPAAGFTPANLLGTAIFAVHARDDATVTVDRSRTVIAGVLTAAGTTAPVYDRRSTQDFLVYNPSLPFHQGLASLVDPLTTKGYPISQPGLDVLYFEGAGGGHGGPLGAFYVPFTYDWMFSHALPEPASLTLATLCLGVLIARRRDPKSQVKGT